jgi:16S rRNA (guanine966-N2)-methyltransferase
VGGRLRGTALAEVGAGDPAAHLRPTSDRVRESLFNVLQGGRHGIRFWRARGCSTCSPGTGALGLEALSRGAAHATFVENGAPALALLRKQPGPDAHRGWKRTSSRTTRRDPAPAPARPSTSCSSTRPGARAWARPRLPRSMRRAGFAPGALVVWEERAAMLPPAGFALRETRRYGQAHVTFLTAP